MFQNAIVRKPCQEMIHGLRAESQGVPDFKLALEQHAAYVEALRKCGLKVCVLEPDPRFPDSTFVEDVALCSSRFTVVTHPGAPTRKGEEKEMEPVLHRFFNRIERINTRGTLEAGDVMMCGTHFYIGISERTNREGAGQLIEILEKYGMSGELVPLKKILHLKSGLSYLENDHLLASGEFLHHPAFKRFKKIKVDEKEKYAANSLWVNDTILVPKGFPSTLTKIKARGLTTLEVDVSEFRKLDGGLSCLSLRF